MIHLRFNFFYLQAVPRFFKIKKMVRGCLDDLAVIRVSILALYLLKNSILCKNHVSYYYYASLCDQREEIYFVAVRKTQCRFLATASTMFQKFSP